MFSSVKMEALLCERRSVSLFSAMVLALKLFFLGVRQVSKPIAGLAKSAAAESPLFRQLMMSAGQSLHRAKIQVSRLTEDKAALAKISPLSEERAVAQGSNLLSESIIYSIATFTVVYEYRLQAKKAAAKEAAEEAAEVRRRDEMRANEERQWERFGHLEQRITLQQEMLWNMQRKLDSHVEQQQQTRRWWLW